jgi:hypothetical protein
MLAFIVLAATTPSLLCVGSAAWLAYKEKSQWVWFAGLSIIAGMGGLQMLATLGGWRLAAGVAH